MSSTSECARLSQDHRAFEVRPFDQTPEPTLHEPWIDDRRRGMERVAHLTIAVIDDRLLIRDCFGRGLSAIDDDLDLKYFSDLNAFDAADPSVVESVNLILICTAWSKAKSNLYLSQIARIQRSRPELDTVILSDIEDVSDIVRAFEAGVRGYIPPTVGLEVAVSAMRLVAAGGIYIPASVLSWYDRMSKQGPTAAAAEENNSIFTSRQMLVIDALRKGKANKIIAYDLNMCESTVKVHVRNIMKRLKARNRTEVVYLLSKLEAARNISSQ